jgi:hypothetical protein
MGCLARPRQGVKGKPENYSLLHMSRTVSKSREVAGVPSAANHPGLFNLARLYCFASCIQYYLDAAEHGMAWHGMALACVLPLPAPAGSSHTTRASLSCLQLAANPTRREGCAGAFRPFAVALSLTTIPGIILFPCSAFDFFFPSIFSLLRI